MLNSVAQFPLQEGWQTFPVKDSQTATDLETHLCPSSHLQQDIVGFCSTKEVHIKVSSDPQSPKTAIVVSEGVRKVQTTMGADGPGLDTGGTRIIKSTTPFSTTRVA